MQNRVRGPKTRSQKTASHLRPRGLFPRLNFPGSHPSPLPPQQLNVGKNTTYYDLRSAPVTLFRWLASMWADRGLTRQLANFLVLTCLKQSRGRRLRDRMLLLPSMTKQTAPGGSQQPPPKSIDSFREKVHPQRWNNVTTFPTFLPNKKIKLKFESRVEKQQ